ncbi:MAG: 23S rRNA (pseudouridine(1915)-N(3))-methyltransferase RlmH [Candidatus Peribacteraceae bacterium]|nr:23S rRNA (pseudouridine(1915)-N(3))-methyltransferase RlmH [Candidatus Peribacteraceae bacterium]
MQRITLLCVGSIKTPWVREGIATYRERLSHDASFELLELAASRRKDSEGQVSEESDVVLKTLRRRDGVVWLLDERGEEWTSVELARELGRLRDQGIHLTLIIGGAYGVSDAVRQRSDRLMSLSRLTLAHEFVRILILEQLYRAMTILRGSGYHH